METIRRRSDLNDVGYSTPAANEGISSKKPVVTSSDYKNDMLAGMIPPLIILLIFGGQLSILVTCFGGLICYIFDLLGSSEGTLFSIVATALFQLVCLVYAARVFLSESLLNVSLMLLFWMVLFYAVLTTGNFFPGVVNEVEVVLAVTNQLVFATLPLVASSLISWFLCVEIPSLNLELCFVFIYFLYMLHVGRPRYITATKTHASNATDHLQVDNHALLLPQYLMIVMYILPIIVSFAMHVALHHNVLSTSHTRIMNALLSVLIPSLLMLFCARRQLLVHRANMNNSKHHGSSSDSDNLPKLLDVIGLLLVTALVLCIQEHPLFDELKAFSDLPDQEASCYIIFAVAAITAGFGLQSFVRKQGKLYMEQQDSFVLNSPSSSARKSKWILSLLQSCASCLFGMAAALLTSVIGLHILPVVISAIGAICLAEFYYRLDHWGKVSNIILVCIATTAAQIAAFSFTPYIVYHLSYVFAWHGAQVSMRDFSSMFALSMAFTVMLPTLPSTADNKHSILANTATTTGTGGMSEYSRGEIDSLLPVEAASSSSSHSTGSSRSSNVLGNPLFQFSFSLMIAIFIAGELMVREEDWRELHVLVDVIYPSYYFTASATLVIVTAIIIYSAGILGSAGLWIVLAMECCKILHLFGVSSPAILAASVLLLSYTLPFVRQVALFIAYEQQQQQHFNQTGNGTAESSAVLMQQKLLLPRSELLTYIIVACFGSYAAYQYSLAHNILTVLISRDPTELQQIALCVGALLGYLGCILSIFYKQFTYIRSVLLASSGLLLLLAFEGFGHLNIAWDPTTDTVSSFYLTVSVSNPDMVVPEHSGLFFLLSTLMTALAWLGIIPLQHNLLMCVIYSLLFGFISTKAMISWAFPLSLGDLLSSSTADALTHDVFTFPFLYLWLCKFLLTFVAVWYPSNGVLLHTRSPSAAAAAVQQLQSSSAQKPPPYPILAQAAFAIACCMPLFGILYAIVMDMYYQAVNGIVWSAILSYASLCVTTRFRELHYEITILKQVVFSSTRPQQQYRKYLWSVCLPCAIMTIFWTCFVVLSSSSAAAAASSGHVAVLDRDILIPLSISLLICTQPGMIIKDTSPLVTVALLCSAFWTVSSIYAILIQGYGTDTILTNSSDALASSRFASYTPHDVLGLDTNISIWTNDSVMWPLLNLAQLLIPIPGIILATLRRKDDTEEMLFALALLSMIPVIGAHISSVRYLGIIGVIFAAARCHEVGKLQQYSERLI